MYEGYNSKFKKFSSKVERINIPLPNFEYNHSTFSDKSNKDVFIEREHLTEKLKSWLINENHKTGVYLVTGYRGMGKSSFVNKVLQDIVPSKASSSRARYKWLFIFIFAIFLPFVIISKIIFNINFKLGFLINPILFIKSSFEIRSFLIENILMIIFIIMILYTVIYMLIRLCLRINFKTPYLNKLLNKIINQVYKDKYFKNLLKWYNKITNKIFDKNSYQIWKRRKRYLLVKLNIGTDNKKDREILCLISSNLYDAFKEHIELYYVKSTFYVFIKNLAYSILTIFIIYIFKELHTLEYHIPEKLTWLNENLRDIIYLKFKFLWFTLFYFSVLFLIPYLINIVFLIISKFIRLTRTPSNLILKELAKLNDRINAQITHENDTETGLKNTNINLNRKHRKAKTYPLADVREIEHELIRILELIDSSVISPRLIFVFDELDKMESNHTDSEDSKDYLPEFENSSSGFPGDSSFRKRKQNTLHILAGMKYFISTAKAKFIFISGRELYDAFLADVSDREFAVSSIFDGVVYIDSFLSSPLANKDISTMTERYICHYLIPKSYLDRYTGDEKQKYSFKTYNSYIKKEKELSIEKENKLLIEKTILFLYHFSIYLSHISNGAPKKIATYLQKYIITKDELEKKGKYKDFTIGLDYYELRNTKYYLSFGYRDQQKINFIHYMAFPVIQAIINSSSNYDDRLLLSASFLTDHIYKHHNSGFSWRNIEYVPELLSANKTPELRDFINSIIGFLKQTHLSNIDSGVYTIKFPQKISEEISILSKLDEEISAIFNFTLDESRSVKRHFHRLLNYYSSKYTAEYKVPGEDKLYNSRVLASIHHILGDLYLSDEEYSNAIFEYLQCANLLTVKNIDILKVEPSHLLFYVRNILKLGLAYEKRKTYDSAYFTYEELISLLMNYRYFDESKYVDYEYDRKHDILKPTRNNTKTESIKRNKFIGVLTDNIDSKIDTILSRLSLFEDVRFIYQVLHAKLFILEKMELGGITKTKIDEVIAEFKYLSTLLNEKEKFAVVVNFYKGLGDIMYYRNGLIKTNPDNYLIRSGEQNSSNPVFNSCIIDTWDYVIDEYLKYFEDFLTEIGLGKVPVYTLKSHLNKSLSNISETDFISTIEILFTNNSIQFSLKQINDDLSKISKNIQYIGKVKDSDFYVFVDKNLFEKLYKAIDLINKKMSSLKTYDESEIFKFFDFILFIWYRTNVEYNKKQNKSDSIENDQSKVYKGSVFNKISKCINKRNNCKNTVLPCSACKYYNTSLRIITKNLFEIPEPEYPNSKVIRLIDILVNTDRCKSLRSDHLSLLASTLDNMGNVMLSCSKTKKNDTNENNDTSDIIKTDFLSKFFNITEFHNKKGLTEVKETEKIIFTDFEVELSFLEKVILYYWTASEYYMLSSNSKEASVCLKKIIHIFVTYLQVLSTLNIAGESIKVIVDNYDKIKNNIISRTLQILYSQYEYTNVAEIQKIKWLFTKEMYEKIDLHALSLFPDIEELLYLDLELQFLLKKDLDLKKVIYKSVLFSPYQFVSTISERVMNLRLKSILNKNYLEIILNLNKEDYYSIELPIIFYEHLNKFLKSTKYNIPELNIELKNNNEKLEFIEFLISDSIFCLTKTTEILTPLSQSTLFTQSYIAEIHQLLFEWNQIYEFIYFLYKFNKLTDESEKKAIIDKLNGFMEIRLEASNNPQNINEYLKMKNYEFNKYYFRSLLAKLKSGKNHKNFFEEILKKIDIANIHFTSNNYQAELAMKHYKKAKEIHAGKKAYSDIISNMFLVDDDLNNNTCQFQYAIERYKLNSGYVENELNNLKKIYWNSTIYDMEKYEK